MKKLYFVGILLLILQLSSPTASHASATLPWSTTFDCPDWTQSDGIGVGDVNCDGISGWGGWTCSPGAKEAQITAAANHPGGGGGKGKREWVGDGRNNNSGHMRLVLTSSYPEFWIRWYVRYDAGFKWGSETGDKMLFFDETQPDSFWVGFQSNKLKIHVYQDSKSPYYAAEGTGWDGIMGGSTSDGQWHSFELHVKRDTNGSNGIAEIWVDGIKKLSVTTINFQTQPGWDEIALNLNQGSPANGGCVPVDMDDVAISTTGYIGPISDNIPPSAPSNIQAQ